MDLIKQQIRRLQTRSPCWHLLVLHHFTVSCLTLLGLMQELESISAAVGWCSVTCVDTSLVHYTHFQTYGQFRQFLFCFLFFFATFRTHHIGSTISLREVFLDVLLFDSVYSVTGCSLRSNKQLVVFHMFQEGQQIQRLFTQHSMCVFVCVGCSVKKISPSCWT